MDGAGGFDLTLGLGLLALAVLAGIGLQGWWQARRARPRRAEPAAVAVASEGDADAASMRLAPVLDDLIEGPADVDDGLSRHDPGLAGGRWADHGTAPDRDAAAETAVVAAGAAVASIPLRATSGLNPLLDAIAPLTLESPASGELALTHLPGSRRAGSKPMRIEGLDAALGSWELPARGRRYAEFRAGVQLVNRAGALNEIEYSELVQKVQAFALGVGALADVPDMLEVVARARELDAFASPRDAQLSVVLRASSVAWSVGYVQQCAARLGFVKGALPGRMALPAEVAGDPPVLVLGFDPQVALADEASGVALREVELSLDVAQTAEAAEPFPTWHRVANELAAAMDATIVDDEGRPVTLHAFDAIGRDLRALYRQLQARGLAAGSPLARRLFS